MTEGTSDTPAPRDDMVEVPASQDAAVETTAEHDPVETPPPVALRARLRRWTNGPVRRYLGRGAAVVAVTFAVAMMATFTIDLGPAVRARLEDAASGYLDREVTIGKVSAYVLPGKFLVEDLVIASVHPGDRPFLTAEQITVSIAWLELRHGVFLVDAEMTDWLMLSELFTDGSMSFPAIVRRRAEAEGPVEPDAPTSDASEEDRGPVYRLNYLRAHRGEFVLDDQGANFDVICANLDLTITNILDRYQGQASCSGGSIRIGDYEPMWMDLKTDFELDGTQVHMTRGNLETDGASTVLEGDVDTANLPEMTFELESDIDFTRMREIFFADDSFTAPGEGHFSGTFHKFEDGYDLRGAITSPVFGLDTDAGQFRFPKFASELVWQRDRFDMWDMTSTFLGGRVRAELSTFGLKDPWQGVFDVRYEDVEVAQLAEFFELNGINPVSRAAGHHRLEWPSEGSGGFRHTGEIQLEPPEGVRLATAEVPPGAAAAVAARADRPADLTSRDFAFGGGVGYTIEDGWIDLTSGRIATPSTHVTFDGRTRFGDQSRIPFQVASTNWQESDRLMSAVMTAVGSKTDPLTIDGVGTFNGVMLGDLAAPRIEASFTGEALRAWHVEWGAGGGEIVVENSYLDLTNGRFRRGDAEIEVDGRFSLGGPRDDGGEELNTVFSMSSFPAANIRAAFGLVDGYTVDGPVTGEGHLYGAYPRPFGVGRLTLDHPVAYGEPFDSWSADLRFEGDGVWLNGLEMRKGAGTITGAAFIGWEEASYSFNWDFRDIAVETLESITTPPEPLSGTLGGSWSGTGRFDDPRYEVRGTITDLFIGDEEVGQVTGRLDVRNGLLSLDLEGISSSVAVSVSGSVALPPENDVDFFATVVNMSLDPYVRMFRPDLSPYATAVVSGSIHVFGERSWDQLHATATIEQVDLSLFDYDIENDGALRLTLDRQVVGVEGWRLVGEDAALGVSGSVDLEAEEVSLEVNGDASLGILRRFFPDLRASGDAVIQAQVTGSVPQPVLRGQATVSAGRIRHLSLPHALEAINGRIVFEPEGIRFDDVPAMMGGGAVRIGGRVGLNGLTPGELAITLTGQEMQVRYPEGFRSTIDADLALVGAADAPVLSGTVTVRDVVLLDGLDIGGVLLGGGVDETVAVSAPEEPGLPLGFDVRFVTPSSLLITNNTTRIVFNADLILQGTYDRPLLFGTAEIDRGEAFVLGSRYRVNYGTVGFANPTRIEPFINVELETDQRVGGRTYRVMVQATGTLNDGLVLTLTSDPPLPEVDIFSLLLGDIRDPQGADLRAARAPELAQQQRLQAGMAQLLTSTLSSGVGRVVEESFGVDTFQIMPSFGDPSSQQSAQLNPTARVLIGKRIAGRAHLTLSRALSGANSDLLVVLEIDQSDRLSWILSQNEDRTYALDFRVRHAF